jgi:hypothetical protein
MFGNININLSLATGVKIVAKIASCRLQFVLDTFSVDFLLFRCSDCSACGASEGFERGVIVQSVKWLVTGLGGRGFDSRQWRVLYFRHHVHMNSTADP